MRSVSFEKLAEKKIRDAIDAGDFDRLPNAGAPIDLEPYFALPSHLRMAYSLLKNANCLPEEVHLLNDVARLERAVAAASEAHGPGLMKELAEARLRLSIGLERLRSDARRSR